MFNDYVQILRSTYQVPELAGKHPPRFPGEEPADPADLPGWIKMADTFASCIGTMFIPWEVDHKCPVRTWDDLQQAYE